MYIHTNIATCSVTQSQCPVLLFLFNFINLFFSGLSRLKGKSRKTFDIIIFTKPVFFNVGFGGLEGAAAPHPWVRPRLKLLLMQHRYWT
jgi:hypothetical protein